MLRIVLILLLSIAQVAPLVATGKYLCLRADGAMDTCGGPGACRCEHSSAAALEHQDCVACRCCHHARHHDHADRTADQIVFEANRDCHCQHLAFVAARSGVLPGRDAHDQTALDTLQVALLASASPLILSTVLCDSFSHDQRMVDSPTVHGTVMLRL